jgi:hypothetical protein
MLDRDQELTLQTLARSIRQCVDAVGPACTARLLGTIALDLTQADRFGDKATASRGRRGQSSPAPTPLSLASSGPLSSVLSIGTQPQHDHGAQA